MLEALGPGTRLGYCTNVHAGHDLDSTLKNLEQHAVVVREQLGVEELGIGLWLSADAAYAALSRSTELRDRIASMGLRVFTFNGFPYCDFHEPVVKHRVYEPHWGTSERLNYTLKLIDVLDRVLPPGEEGSISTLPLAWPTAWKKQVDDMLVPAALRQVAARLSHLEKTRGRFIHVDLEPEPGCLLQRSDDVVRFFCDSLLAGQNTKTEEQVRRYLRVCHDVCHSAVMFEPQAEVFARYAAAGISVGKVQISSALCARFEGIPVTKHQQAFGQLRQFHEARYLHQTCVKTDLVRAYEDLPLALEAAGDKPDPCSEWRVHFHVPVHVDAIGLLDTSNDQIGPAVALARAAGVKHFEVETYAWSVVPSFLAAPELAAGIASELRWVMALAKRGEGDAA